MLAHPGQNITSLAVLTRARFLARSKPRMCSANHGAGFFSNLACDWLSTGLWLAEHSLSLFRARDRKRAQDNFSHSSCRPIFCQLIAQRTFSMIAELCLQAYRQSFAGSVTVNLHLAPCFGWIWAVSIDLSDIPHKAITYNSIVSIDD